MYNRNCCDRPNVYQMPCIEPRVVNRYHVECERVEVPVVTKVVHHHIRKPMFCYVPVCEEEHMQHPLMIEDNCKPHAVPYHQPQPMHPQMCNCGCKFGPR